MAGGRTGRWMAVLVVGLWLGGAGGADASTAPDEALRQAYDLAYNLDHDEAIAALHDLVRAHPDDPAPYRGVAALTWLRLLFLRGAVLVDAQMTSSIRGDGEVAESERSLAETFRTNIETAIELAEAAVDRDDTDVDALYQLGASIALAASFKASVDGEGIRALRDARRAYETHSRVLELDPSRRDAGLTLGIYRYLVSLLPRPIRMMAYLVGFDGGREEALQLIEQAALHAGETETEARFALVLLYNRERRYADAQRVLTILKRRFPRNRLLWLESASTWLRDDHPFLAARDLARGLAMLERDPRPRMLAEDEVWMLKRGTARVALERVGAARPDLERALTAADRAWIQGRAHVELGKIADLAGDRDRARDAYDRGRRLCREANDRRCERAAEELKEHGYSAD